MKKRYLQLVSDENMQYGEELKSLCSTYDIEEMLSFQERVSLFGKMLRFAELKVFALDKIQDLTARLMSERDIKGVRLLKRALADEAGYELRAFVPASKTFHEDDQNVHALSAETVRVALELIEKFGSEYERPFEGYDRFFEALERHRFHAFDPKRLFSAVYSYAIRSHHAAEIMSRMKEEMTESEGLCITGCIVRLLNALRGFDERVQVNLDEFEAAKMKAFHELTRAIDPCGDDVLGQICKALNDKIVVLPHRYALKILAAYTGEKWTVRRSGLKNVFLREIESRIKSLS